MEIRRRHMILPVIALVALLLFVFWPSLINVMLPADCRPAVIHFSAKSISEAQFAALSDSLTRIGQKRSLTFDHIEHFAEAGILVYEGPHTCLSCHDKITVADGRGGTQEVGLLDNLTDSVHYRFFSSRRANVFGFNGNLADNFPMGKINRPCPKPGSFAMTCWAEPIITPGNRILSEGCGQCHIGGQYQAPLGEIMPGYRTIAAEKAAIDCLICHAVLYDMNKKQIVTDRNHRHRWGQDRTLRAALSVTRPVAQACLRCHQHNMGGDIYVDPADSTYMERNIATGTTRPRVSHPGSKRGTPFSPSWDVHAAAGLDCLDCHTSRGHYIARGTHTTTIMANDLVDVEVSCLNCHDDQPHPSSTTSGLALNRHLARLACQTCHIPSLHPDNVTRRNFTVTEFDAEMDIHTFTDQVKLSAPGEGIAYVWWNGDGTFLGNPIGDNPNEAGLYCFYTAEWRWPEFADFDYESWYKQTMVPLARSSRPSKIYPMKRYNGKQHIDLANIGPFGGMFVPYNLPEYYRFGVPEQAARVEMDKSMMGMMYGWLFKFYMLDRFMSYMAIDGWETGAFTDVRAGRNIDPRWMPSDAMLEISHAIRRDGALTCGNCHGPEGVMDWIDLGYTPEEIAILSEPQ